MILEREHKMQELVQSIEALRTSRDVLTTKQQIASLTLDVWGWYAESKSSPDGPDAWANTLAKHKYPDCLVQVLQYFLEHDKWPLSEASVSLEYIQATLDLCVDVATDSTKFVCDVCNKNTISSLVRLVEHLITTLQMDMNPHTPENVSILLIYSTNLLYEIATTSSEMIRQRLHEMKISKRLAGLCAHGASHIISMVIVSLCRIDHDPSDLITRNIENIFTPLFCYLSDLANKKEYEIQPRISRGEILECLHTLITAPSNDLKFPSTEDIFSLLDDVPNIEKENEALVCMRLLFVLATKGEESVQLRREMSANQSLISWLDGQELSANQEAQKEAMALQWLIQKDKSRLGAFISQNTPSHCPCCRSVSPCSPDSVSSCWSRKSTLKKYFDKDPGPLNNVSLWSLAEEVGKEWFDLGIRLGYKKAALERFCTQYERKIDIITFQMLHKFKEKKSGSDESKVEEICQALQKCGRRDLAEELDPMYGLDRDISPTLTLEKELGSKFALDVNQNQTGVNHNQTGLKDVAGPPSMNQTGVKNIASPPGINQAGPIGNHTGVEGNVNHARATGNMDQTNVKGAANKTDFSLRPPIQHMRGLDEPDSTKPELKRQNATNENKLMKGRRPIKSDTDHDPTYQRNSAIPRDLLRSISNPTYSTHSHC